MSSDALRPTVSLQTLRKRLQGPLTLCLAVSLAAHLVALLVLEHRQPEPEELQPLTATITELPPPPLPATTSPKPKRKPRAAAPAVPAFAEPETSAGDAVATGEPFAPPAEAAREALAAAAASEEVIAAAPPEATPPRELPPRIELAYRGYLGTAHFFVGDAIYRLEHAANEYKITTVGEARGLAALFIRGQGRLTSTGTITRHGLQPNLYTIDRTNDSRHEEATFDWETGVVLLNDNKTAALEIPTFDPLVVLWQFYFSPPDQDEVKFNIATTRRVYHYSFRRTGSETVTLSFGDVEAEVWERASGDGSVNAKVWLAPSLHHVMVKMQLSNERALVEALLDGIRVDETVAQR